jgi:hypothetical protein
MGGTEQSSVQSAKAEAIEAWDGPLFDLSLGPAGEIIRLAGDRAAHLHEPVADALRAELADWPGPDGVIAPSSTWIVTAVAPADPGHQR